jgi:hypothetical protein
MWSRKHAIAFLVLPSLVASCYGAGVDELASRDEATQEAAAALTCAQICQADFQECMSGCFGIPDNPDLPSNPCEDPCIASNNICLYSNFAFKQTGNTVCHVDIDTHLSGVDIEFYTVDIWQDLSCAHQADRYRKRYLGKVSCSHWTGLTHPSVCTTRVENKLAQLAGQGYVPAFTEPDADQCPTPRL